MQRKLIKILASIVIVVLLLALTLTFTEITGVTSLVTGAAMAQISAVPGTDYVMFKIHFLPGSLAAPPATPAAPWDFALYNNAVYNPDTVLGKTVGDVHACDVEPYNQIGRVNPNGGDFYPPGSMALLVPPAGPAVPVCYSHFDCRTCLRFGDGCGSYYDDGYACSFSVAGANYGNVAQCDELSYNVVCKEACYDQTVSCPALIENPVTGDSGPFTACGDDGSVACCAPGTCAYNGACYNPSDQVDMGGMDVHCINQHWCPIAPDGTPFSYNPVLDKCYPSEASCYEPATPSKCNTVYPGLVSTDPYWTDSGCLIDNPPGGNMDGACCTVTISSVDFYFEQPITYSMSGLYLEHATICGDTMNVGPADGFCPSELLADCTPGNTDDADCCASCSWTCDDFGAVCGDNPSEVIANEKDSTGVSFGEPLVETCAGLCTEEVIDDSDASKCITSATDCVDDGVVYSSYPGSGACVPEVNCHDVDGVDDPGATGDLEICDSGNWHDPDESEMYCMAANFLGINEWLDSPLAGIDDYNDADPFFCVGDDGFSVWGYVYNEDGDPLENVHVNAVEVTNTGAILQERFTDATGYYMFSAFSSEYQISYELSFYADETVQMELTESGILPEVIMSPTNECISTCTRNDNVCHADCDGIALCSFPTNSYIDPLGNTVTVADACDNMQEGWVRPFGAGYEVVCCDSSPQAEVIAPPVVSPGNTVASQVSTSVRHILVRGVPVQLHLVVYEE